MKKIISLCLAISMLLCFIPVNTFASPAKDGYTLVPMLYGKTGVDVSSPFILAAPEMMTLDALIASLSIDGQPAPQVVQNTENEFLITPSVTLSSNSLYIFRLKRDGKEDITWAFQTAKKFQVTSSFPRNEATNVPKNSGIEVTFSSGGYIPIDSYFSISPHVEGRFEYHKDTAVFVPEALDYKTVYTVTVKAGIKLEGTNEAVLTDYVFAFETEAEPEYKPPTYSESAYFYSKYIELPAVEAPRLGFGIYHTYGTPLPNPKVNVYKFGGNEKAVQAIKILTDSPDWSRYTKEEELIDTYGLSRIMSFDAKDHYDEDGNALLLPDKLSQGFYLIDTALGSSRDQMIVQISDLPVQVIADHEQAVFWVNDIGTGKASAGATVYDAKEGKTYQTDTDGIAVVDRPLIAANLSEQFVITSTNGKTCVWLCPANYYRYNTGNANEAYWTALQLDRTLFKRDDTVSFFGFVQDRENNEEITSVSAVLTQGSYYGYYGVRDILHRQTVPVQNSTYSDEMKLPNLDVGSYCLTIYHGDIVLGSTYFTVQDYVKPAYKIDVTADKKAVFAGDTVTFTAKAGFFEGTPVADLDISYRVSSGSLTTSGNGQAKTDISGKAEVSQQIIPQAGAQGQASLSFTAEATLPEIGRTTKSSAVRAFINDIDVKTQAKRTKENAALTVNIHSITLDRINSGTAKHYYDYLDTPVAGKALSVEVYRVYYEKVKNGEYYDYIEKKVRSTYRYDRKEEKIDGFDMVTNQDGTAERNFTVPDRLYESYFAKIACVDGNGREISQTSYIGNDYSSYWRNANTNNYFLDGENKNYGIGEEVNLTLKRGTDTVTKGNFLFVTMQRGIQSWQAGKNPYSFQFSQAHIPNISVHAYYFNGYNYQSNYYMSRTVRFDYAKNDLTLTAVTDKESYKPGDTCSMIVTAKDKNGNAKEANVNISIVDEALFALKNNSVDTLTSLYRMLSSGLRLSVATHRTYVQPAYRDGDAGGTVSGGGNSAAAPVPIPTPAPGEANSDDTELREIFKDTAIFGTIRTNGQGEAVYTFRLPDNITSWRLTMSGISDDLYAGNGVQNIIVTNPMFLSYTLNDEFLVGDIPTVGVNVYGASLTGGETVDFEVWEESVPDKKYIASGVAFERVNIPLWEMKNEGANALIIKATVSNGTSDAVKHPYTVYQTYRQIDEAVYYDVTTDTVFDVGDGGLTNITFTDRSRGAFLRELICLRNAAYGGDRIEKMLVHREADKILEKYFADAYFYGYEINFDPKRYQCQDGGIAILPYAGSDLETTVKLMPYIKDEVNVHSLKNYLYNIYEGDNAENKMCALYGLAMLREPVLLDLDQYAAIDDLSVKDAVYIALGYCALGETETASVFYDGRIAPRLEDITPYYRVNTGVDQDDILEATSAANMLAAQLGKPEKDGLYQYCIHNYTTDILINIEKLSHIEHEISKRTDVSGGITYTLFDKTYTKTLENGGSYTLRIPSQNMSAFKLLEITGDVGAVSAYKKPMVETGGTDTDITVRRRYYKANEYENSSDTFEQGDLVRVQIWIDYTKKAVNGSYCVTDYLPSGLEYVSGSAKIGGAPHFGYGYYRYCTVEGQKLTFYDYNGTFDKGYLYYYYARVVSPGTFKAEGPLVQSLTAKDCFTVGEDSVIVIE